MGSRFTTRWESSHFETINTLHLDTFGSCRPQQDEKPKTTKGVKSDLDGLPTGLVVSSQLQKLCASCVVICPGSKHELSISSLANSFTGEVGILQNFLEKKPQLLSLLRLPQLQQ